MGQKINPLGFRLGTTQDHHSLWFEEPKDYPEGLQEDKRIRNCIKYFVQKKISSSFASSFTSIVEGITHIEIKKKKFKKKIDEINIIIYMGFTTLLLESKPKKSKEKEEGIKKVLEELKPHVRKELTYVNQINQKLKFTIQITQIKNPYGHPKILAEFIGGQLKNRVSFRKAMKKAIELTEQAKTKGIQIKIAGRLHGKQIARVDWIREGRVPLQTIRAQIDYCSYTVRTLYGIFGIKIWIFRDHKY